MDAPLATSLEALTRSVVQEILVPTSLTGLDHRAVASDGAAVVKDAKSRVPVHAET